MLRIELRPASNGKPGTGELTIYGWKWSLESELQISIQNNQNDYYLDATGGWTASVAWQALDDVKKNEGNVLAMIGPWLIDPLIQHPDRTYLIRISNAEGSDQGVLRVIGTLLSSQAAGHSRNSSNASASRFTAEPEAEPFDPNPFRSEPEPEPEPFDPNPFRAEPEEELISNPFVKPAEAVLFEAEPELIGPPPPVASPPKLPVGNTPSSKASPRKKTTPTRRRKSGAPIGAIIAVVLLLLLGLLGYWWFFMHTADKSFVTGNASASGNGVSGPAQKITSVPAACSSGTLTDTTDDLLFIRTCLDARPTTQQVLDVIANAKQSQRCELVQRLYAYKAQAGDVAIAMAYAGEYDPQSFSGGCISAADAETAVYWYEIALEHEPQNPQARRRLQELKP